MSWHLGPMAAFDLETTGLDVETDRIVTACVAIVDGSRESEPRLTPWLLDPGIDIPKAATAIHGVTTEKARAEGKPAVEGVAEIVAALVEAVEAGIPLVVFNALYDLTLLDRNCRHLGIPTLTERCERDGLTLHVIDPLVLDRAADRRSGSRRLADACAHYGVRIDGAHDSAHDALAAARVAWRIAQRYPRIAGMSLAGLHEMQTAVKPGQDRIHAARLSEQARRARTADEQIDLYQRAERVAAGHWPLVPYDPQRQEAL